MEINHLNYHVSPTFYTLFGRSQKIIVFVSFDGEKGSCNPTILIGGVIKKKLTFKKPL